MACVACGSALEFFGPRAGYAYARCRDCATIQLDPQPTAAELARAYRSYATAGHYEADPDVARRVNANNYRTLCDALVAHRVRGPVLDYGAGWGGLVEMLRSRGFECVGLDLDPHMVDSGRRRGLPLRVGSFEAVDGERFAALTLATVFEHLVEHDRWLEEAHRALLPGGLLVTLNPTARFAHLAGTALRLGRRRRELPELVELYSPPWHTAFFSIRGMQQLLARHGFDLLEVRWTPCGRKRGLPGVAQAVLESVNRLGWRLAGSRWPLQVCHTFVFRKVERS